MEFSDEPIRPLPAPAYNGAMVQDPTPGSTRLQRYLRDRSGWEAGFWVVFYGLQATANSYTVSVDVRRQEVGIEAWEPWVWEFSSNFSLLILIPLLLAFDRRFPLWLPSLKRNLPWHLLATLAYCLIHVLCMVGLRKLAYASVGERYVFGNWPAEYVYEYAKDLRSYLFTLALVYFYRLTLLRLQGEASMLDLPDEGLPVEPVERPRRLLVKKLGREFLIAVDDIERLEAAENYVNLHVRGRIYPLRSTMAAINAKLDPEQFVRVHRSHIVALAQVREIQPLESGDARLLLADGSKVPCSRRYRAVLNGRSG